MYCACWGNLAAIFSTSRNCIQVVLLGSEDIDLLLEHNSFLPFFPYIGGDRSLGMSQILTTWTSESLSEVYFKGDLVAALNRSSNYIQCNLAAAVNVVTVVVTAGATAAAVPTLIKLERIKQETRDCHGDGFNKWSI